MLRRIFIFFVERLFSEGVSKYIDVQTNICQKFIWWLLHELKYISLPWTEMSWDLTGFRCYTIILKIVLISKTAWRHKHVYSVPYALVKKIQKKIKLRNVLKEDYINSISNGTQITWAVLSFFLHACILLNFICCLNWISRQFNLVNLFWKANFPHFLSAYSSIANTFAKEENLLTVNFEICVTCFLFLSLCIVFAYKSLSHTDTTNNDNSLTSASHSIRQSFLD